MAKSRLIWLILILALLLRLLFALTQDPLTPYSNHGADSGWYLGNGYALITGEKPDDIVTMPVRLASPNYFTRLKTLITGQAPGTLITDVSRLSSPPLYFILIGIPLLILAKIMFALGAVWYGLRCVVGVIYLAQGEPYPRPYAPLV